MQPKWGKSQKINSLNKNLGTVPSLYDIKLHKRNIDSTEKHVTYEVFED